MTSYPLAVVIGCFRVELLEIADTRAGDAGLGSCCREYRSRSFLEWKARENADTRCWRPGLCPSFVC
jgi:hypothetical protein